MSTHTASASDLEDNYIHLGDTRHDESSEERDNRRRYILLWVLRITTIALIVTLFALTIHFSVLLFKPKKLEKFSSRLEASISHPHFSRKLNGLSGKNVVNELSEMYSLGGISNDAWLELSDYLEFSALANHFEKSYDGLATKHAKYLNFKRNKDEIKSHESNTGALYKKGVNAFFDENLEELSARLLRPIPGPVNLKTTKHSFSDIRVTEHKRPLYAMLKGHGMHVNRIKLNELLTFEDIDWRNAGIVTPVKNQKACGSCWAFAAVAAVESAILQETSNMVLLSEQELVNCEKRCSGCSGGYSDVALEYIMHNGISSEERTPYNGYEGVCEVVPDNRHYIGSYVSAIGKDVANKLLVRAPTVVYIAVTTDFMLYSGGIYNGNCETAVLNHAVLLVGEGYDAELKKRYWLIKNSWGPEWGENGYIRIERTDIGNDKCGVLTFGFLPYGYRTARAPIWRSL